MIRTAEGERNLFSDHCSTSKPPWADITCKNYSLLKKGFFALRKMESDKVMTFIKETCGGSNIKKIFWKVLLAHARVKLDLIPIRINYYPYLPLLQNP